MTRWTVYRSVRRSCSLGGMTSSARGRDSLFAMKNISENGLSDVCSCNCCRTLARVCGDMSYVLSAASTKGTS